MPVTITLKNIPDAIYAQLKFAAEIQHRSLNSEAIVCLETVLLPTKKTPLERLARARTLRNCLEGKKISAVDIDELKHQDQA